MVTKNTGDQMKRWQLYLERTKHGFTQEQIAQKLGISKQGYNRIELGRRGASPEIWDALEDMFGVDQRELRAGVPNRGRRGRAYDGLPKRDNWDEK